jgi:hypothetical protein
MNNLLDKSGAKITLSLNATLAGILRVLVDTKPDEASIAVGKAIWLYENIPLETLKAQLDLR